MASQNDSSIVSGHTTFGNTATDKAPQSCSQNLAALPSHSGDKACLEINLRQQLECSQSVNRDLVAKLRNLREEINRYKALEAEREAATQAALVESQEREQDVARRELEVQKKEANLQGREEKMQAKREHIVQRGPALDERVKSETAAANAHDAHTSSGRTHHLNDKTNGKKLRRPTKRGVFTYGSRKNELFEVFPNLEFDLSSLPHIDMENPFIRRLRRSDYYRGWLDCARATQDLDVVSKSVLGRIDAKLIYITDWNNPRNPRNAGVNAALTLYYSILCKKHGKEDWDVRIDNRAWKLEDLEAPKDMNVLPGSFWEGLQTGMEVLERKFQKMMEEAVDEQM